MVQLTQVEDETVVIPETASNTTPLEKEEDFEDVSDEETDEEYNDDLADETLYDRIVALKEIVPPAQRSLIQNTVSSFGQLTTNGIFSFGNLLWIISSSVLLLGVPASLSILSEQQLVEMENEMKMQQDSANVLAPGSEGAFEEKK